MEDGTFLVGGSVDRALFKETFKLNYYQGWTFDETTEITICSDLNEDKSIQCDVHNLKVAYSINSITSAADLIEKSFPFFLFIVFNSF